MGSQCWYVFALFAGRTYAHHLLEDAAAMALLLVCTELLAGVLIWWRVLCERGSMQNSAFLDKPTNVCSS